MLAVVVTFVAEDKTMEVEVTQEEEEIGAVARAKEKPAAEIEL